jgi:hypothetical protein
MIEYLLKIARDKKLDVRTRAEALKILYLITIERMKRDN